MTARPRAMPPPSLWFAAALGALPAAGATPAEPVPWRSDVSRARAEAHESQKPLFIVFR